MGLFNLEVKQFNSKKKDILLMNNFNTDYEYDDDDGEFDFRFGR